MKHKHHIIPKHMGGTNDPTNLIELSVEDHAEAHRKLYEENNLWQDYVAWQGLAKLSPKAELVRLIQSEAAKEWHRTHKNPFAGIRTNTNFAINDEHRNKTCKLANNNEAIAKKKQTFYEIKHQQKEKNSQFGTCWCVQEHSIDITERRKFCKNKIPQNWITTTEWKERRKNKNSNAYGRHWYNDGNKNYYLYPDDSIIDELHLVKRRLTNINIAV